MHPVARVRRRRVQDAFTTFLKTLNDGSFAGSSGWRMPSLYELATLGEPGFPNCIGSVPCTTIPGSTVPFFYWSSSTYAVIPQNAWGVYCNNGLVGGGFKRPDGYYVRAVRGGS